MDIEIEKMESNFDIQLEYIGDLNGNDMEIKSQGKKRFKDENESFLKVIIPTEHQAVFVLTIHGTNRVDFFNELITIKTNYQVKI